MSELTTNEVIELLTGFVALKKDHECFDKFTEAVEIAARRLQAIDPTLPASDNLPAPYTGVKSIVAETSWSDRGAGEAQRKLQAIEQAGGLTGEQRELIEAAASDRLRPITGPVLRTLLDSHDRLAAENERLKAERDQRADFVSFLEHYLNGDSDERNDWDLFDDRWKELAIESAEARHLGVDVERLRQENAAMRLESKYIINLPDDLPLILDFCQIEQDGKELDRLRGLLANFGETTILRDDFAERFNAVQIEADKQAEARRLAEAKGEPNENRS